MSTIEEKITASLRLIEGFDAKFAKAEDLEAMRAQLKANNEDMKKIEASLNDTPTITADKNAKCMTAAMFSHMRNYANPSNEWMATQKLLAEATPSSVNIGQSAGYLCPPEYKQEILRMVEDLGSIRAFARGFTTSASAIEIPVEVKGTQAGWVGEKQTGMDSDPVQYGMRKININGIFANVAHTRESLMDNLFNIEQETSRQVSEAFAKQENRGFLYGNGKNMPDGLITDPQELIPKKNVVALDITDADAADKLIKITRNLPVSNKGSYAFYMNNYTYTEIRTLKVPTATGIGDYAYKIALNQAGEKTINGFPIRMVPELPNFDDTVATAKDKIVGGKCFAILFGDMSRAYGIADRSGMEYVQDDISRKMQRITEFTFWNRLGGGVLDGTQMLKIDTTV